MKQKDVALIMIVAFISGMASFFISNLLFASSNDKKQQVEVVDQINANFDLPNATYFNKDSINPTQLIKIGDSSNPDPFKGGSQ